MIPLLEWQGWWSISSNTTSSCDITELQLVVNPAPPANLGFCHRWIETYDTARLDVKSLVDAGTGTSIYGDAVFEGWGYGE